MKALRLLSGALLALLLIVGGFASAQTQVVLEDGLEEDISVGSSGEGFPGTVSCFDYYQFGSVHVDLTKDFDSVVSGTNITFTGTIKNDNPYPIVDGAVYVKVLRSRGDRNDGNGPDVVDQFFAKGDIVIPANGTVPLSFSWHVPSNALSGEYRLATFFTVARKFNMAGLSFTDDIVGAAVPFSVVGEIEDGVAFDKTAVTVAGEPYRSATALPVVDAGTPVTIEAKIANDTASSQTVRVLWEIYQWDAQLRENVVQEESKTITVPSHSSAPISITVTDTEYPAYLAVGKLDWKDTSSIVNVRFARDGVDRARINFPGTLSFPLTDGQPNGVFSCLHDSGEYDIPSGGRLDLRLLDRDSNIIHEYHYEGGISSAMMGLLSEFTPKKNYDYVLLNARLSQDGEFVDEVTLIYDCMRIDPSQCRGESGGDWSALPLDILVKAGPILLLVGVVLVTFIVLLAILKYLNRAAARPPEPPSLDNL